MTRTTIRGAAGLIARRRPSGFAFQSDTTGYTIPVPTAHNFPTTALTSVSQPGSRIYFVDSELGDDATAGLYFWNGTAIVDSSNSTTGAGGVPYGTDPFNPTGPIKPFKRYYTCAPRTNGTDYTGTPTNAITQSNATPFRAGKPDWWLFRRGKTVDLYADFRGYLDNKGLTTTAINASPSVMGTGGSSTSAMCVIGAYGPVADGRARFIHAPANFFSRNGGTYGYTLYTGLMTDGTVRDRAIRPVDWNVINYYDQGIYPVFFINLSNTNPEIWFEDCHFHACGGSFSYQWAFTHTIPTNGLRMYRNIISNNWGCSLRWIMEARKTTGDQVVPANTAAILTWPTVVRDNTAGSTGTGSGAMDGATGTYTILAANAYTSWGGQRYFNVWALMDVQAIIPPTGSITVEVLVNGVSKSSYSVPGTDGANLATYQLHTPLETGPCATGNTIQVRISTTGALSALTVLGTSTARLTIHQIEQANSSGHFMTTCPGTRFEIRENIYVTNGFGVNPALQTSTYPDGTAPRFDWDTRNHNLYFVGDITDWTNCIFKGNVSLVGAAGDNGRCPIVSTQNFYYQGYVELKPEHNTVAFTSKMSEWSDNVLQRFRSVFGVTSAHPVWGLEVSSGSFGVDVKRNIVSDTGGGNADGFGTQAVKISGMNSPYFAGAQLVWINDTSSNIIDGNIFDCTGNTKQFSEPIMEANGSRYIFSQWQAFITPGIGTTTGNITGTVLTCTPSPGYTGTPLYQWYRYPISGTDSNKILIAGATGNTYTLGAQGTDWTVARGVNYYMVACHVTGITYPPGTGMNNNVASNNVYVMPTLYSDATPKQTYFYYVMNSSANPAPPAVIASAPTTGTLTQINNQQYATRALAQAARGGSNWEASLKTAMVALQIPVTSVDGLPEYRTTILGANPQVTAMMRGKSWDTRFTGRQLGNHVRAGRGMAQVASTSGRFDEGTDTGTQWFVRPNGGTYGLENGTSWTNAFDGFAGINWASISAGDTIWVAGGTYTQFLQINKAGTSSNPIKIRRARADSAQCVGAAGWSAGFDATVVHREGIEFLSSGNWIIISGATVQGGGVDDSPSSYGWKIDLSTFTAGSGISWGGAGSNNVIRWLEMEGAGEINVTGDMRAIDMTPGSGTAANNTLAHVWAHDWESFAYCVSASAPIFEYCVVEDIAPLNTPSFHPNGIITWGCPNGIVRYSTFRKGPNGLGCGEGIFFEQSGGSTAWQIYGNLFHDLDYTGLKAIEISSAVGAIKVYNNTFVNILVGSLYTSDAFSAVGGEWKNNLNYLSSNNTIGTASNNVVASSSACFVSFAGKNFHITSSIGANLPRNAGVALTTNGFYDKDRDGVTRGGDGTWDVGAYEYA